MKAHENPFRSTVIDGIPFVFVRGDWNQVMSRLRHLRYRAEVSGKQGSGKSTFFWGLRQRLEERGLAVERFDLSLEKTWVQRRELLRWAVFFKGVTMVDGADLLPPWQWRFVKWVSLQKNGLVAATHRAGMLAPLLHLETSEKLLGCLLERIAPEGVKPVELLRGENLGDLWRRYDGDAREVFLHLYVQGSVAN